MLGTYNIRVPLPLCVHIDIAENAEKIIGSLKRYAIISVNEYTDDEWGLLPYSAICVPF